MRSTSACSARVPYRIDIRQPHPQAAERLIELGALDIDQFGEELAAVLPDEVPADILRALSEVGQADVSEAVGRDDGSIWVLGSSAVQVGALTVAAANSADLPHTIRLIDTAKAFGTGRHSTTSLCLQALEEVCAQGRFARMLDIGTGSGILALAALRFGIPQATGIDIDAQAVAIAKRNAELNGVRDRLELIVGETPKLTGQWPLITANLLPAPLVDMAFDIARLLAPQGTLILSGIQQSLQAEVRRAYERVGIHIAQAEVREGWAMLVGQASW